MKIFCKACGWENEVTASEMAASLARSSRGIKKTWSKKADAARLNNLKQAWAKRRAHSTTAR